MPVECSKCGQPAVYLRKHTAEKLCKACLIKTTIDRVRRTINRHKMLSETDRIAVAISGGKDSAVLLHILAKIEEDFPRTQLIPITIDEGIKGYRDKAMDAAKELVSNLDMTLEIRSFKDLFSHTLDEIVNLREENSVGACSYCGVLRRRAINLTAIELRADIVATGHNLDDEAQTVLMNIMRGDSRRMVRTNRPRHSPIPGLVPRIKPIIELSERDIVAYSHHQNLPYHDIPCPYHVEAMRNDLRNFLNDMEHKRPGTLLAILHSAEAIMDAFTATLETSEFQACEKCGSPASARICKVCTLLDDIGG